MSSENPSGADNQQETSISNGALDPWWLVGFVDGEGCFSVAVHRQPSAKRSGGWQLTPVFQVYQHEAHRELLESIREFFQCGRVVSKGPRSHVLTFAVSKLSDLDTRIVPFFEQHAPLVKRDDFGRFASIVRSMRAKEHLEPDGFRRLVTLAYEMNAHGKQRSRTIDEILEGSSETAR